MALESGTECVARMVSHPGGLATPELLEDMRSFAESFPYIVRPYECGEPIRCECCGTFVALTPEREVTAGPGGLWKPAIWECGTLRKHTLRRCQATSGPLQGRPVHAQPAAALSRLPSAVGECRQPIEPA